MRKPCYIRRQSERERFSQNLYLIVYLLPHLNSVTFGLRSALALLDDEEGRAFRKGRLSRYLKKNQEKAALTIDRNLSNDFEIRRLSCKAPRRREEICSNITLGTEKRAE